MHVQLSADEGEKAERKGTAEETEGEDKDRKPRRKAYVHKPFLYSRYYSDSDDEVTVEERRRSAVSSRLRPAQIKMSHRCTKVTVGCIDFIRQKTKKKGC